MNQHFALTTSVERGQSVAGAEHKLIVAIIEAALQDATSTGTGTTDLDREAARRFLIEKHGAIARWRRELLELVGLDADATDERLRALADRGWPRLKMTKSREGNHERRPIRLGSRSR